MGYLECQVYRAIHMGYVVHILYIYTCTCTDYLVLDLYRWMWSVSYSPISY